MTLLVRDEIDIIRTFLDFHFAEGVDFMIVTDNGSKDGTVDVLREYEAAGRIELIHEPPSDYSQHRWVTRMARIASSHHGADWVINADADEFFLSRQIKLRDVFSAISPETKVFATPRHDFAPIDRPGLKTAPLEMTYRVDGSLNLFNRNPLVPKAIHRGHPKVTVKIGNHRAFAPGFPNPRYEFGPIEVFHYPIRDYPQFVSKSVNAGSSLEKNRELSDKVARRPRLWYRMWKEGTLENEYWTNIHCSRQRLDAALQSGDLVEDITLANRLTEYGIA